MGGSKRKTRKPRKTAKNIWGQLADICRKIHVRLYVNHDKRSARRYVHRLELIMKELPENNLAIIRQEGAALLSELKNDLAGAIQHRTKEIELIERLHKSVQESVARGDYDAETAAWALQGRDSKALRERRSMLRALEEQVNAYQQRDGVRRIRSEKGGRLESGRKHSVK